MNIRVVTSLILTATLAAVGAACSKPAGSGNAAANRNTAMSNGNSQTSSMQGTSPNGNANVPKMTGDMMESAPNASSAAYDLQFIDTMTAHHQSAISMAQLAATNSENPELKKFAQKIVDDQKKEIATLSGWREKWFAGKPSAINMQMPGMMDSMKGMDMAKLTATKGKEFDLMFIDSMTPHHAAAVAMAQEALTKAERPEIKSMAQQIIKAQQSEIAQMKDWRTKWSAQ